LKSHLPSVRALYTGEVGETSGEYCYSVWLRHLVRVSEAVAEFRCTSVVEVGPGDSLGLGCAALLAGADRYVALDVVEHASISGDLRVLDELVPLVTARAPIPGDARYPELHPRLASYAFPSRLFEPGSSLRLEVTPERVASIRAALPQATVQGDSPLRYVAPWTPSSVEPGSVDLVLSQAVLQDVEETDRRRDLSALFAAMSRWLRPGGVMSHQINFAFEGWDEWNHHWRFPDAVWSVVRGRRPFFENRLPLSAYRRLCEAHGCQVVAVNGVRERGLGRGEVAARFRQLPEEDFVTPGAHIVAVKR
jgi:hypothetical protein